MKYVQTVLTRVRLAMLIFTGITTLGCAARNSMDLSGKWRFELDPAERGVAERWFSRPLADAIQLPGSLQAQGFGEDVAVDTAWTADLNDRSYFEDPRYAPYREPGKVKIPFWLQPDKHYVGAAWYQREVAVPADWSSKRIVLILDRPHWWTQVWVDDREIGIGESLGTPHTFELTDALTAGRTHKITVRVDNHLLIDVGKNSHSVSDHTQTNWNGIIGNLKLVATDRVWIDEIHVYPHLQKKAARLRLRLGNATGAPCHGTLTVQAMSYNVKPVHQAESMAVQVQLDPGENTVEIDYPLGADANLWDEFSPALYRLCARIECQDSSTVDEKTVTFGLREFGTDGTQFTMNSRRLFLRGTLECCIFPLTGYPPTDVAAWKRIIRICKAHGLNHIRFHSWAPPEAAFVAADELGFYFQVECSSWANQGATIGESKPLDAWLYHEGERVIAAYGNHPSFVMMAYGNEPAGPDRGKAYLARWVEHFKRLDPRRKYTCASGWPMIPESEYHVTPDPRIQQWGAGIHSRINAHPPETKTDYRDIVNQYKVPAVGHETGQWCAYPNFAEITKYTGTLKAKNFEIFRDFLEGHHMGDQARDFLMASGKLQVLCYKEEIESALRTPGFGGFQLLDLHDFPGQGTALVGVLDPFWDSKPYVTPDEYHRFSCETVPLARLPKRIFTSDEKLTAKIDIAHFGPRDFHDVPACWRLIDSSGSLISEGTLSVEVIPTGALTPLGKIEVPLNSLSSPQQLKLEVSLRGTVYANDWAIWVYPKQLSDLTLGTKDIHVANELDEAALSCLRAGGKVLLLFPPGRVSSSSVIGFSSVFWNTSWTRGQAPHTLGILCNPAHPVLAEFPTEYHSDWQWWDLIHHSAAMVLDGMPAELRPLIQVIDTWFEARRLGLAFEAQVAGGKLIVCSIDLEHDLESRPVARQFRHSLLDYMTGDEFAPQHTVSPEQIRRLAR